MTTRALIPVDKETFEALERRVTLLEQRAATSESEDDDEGCPYDDPDCMGKAGDCHDACERPQESRLRALLTAAQAEVARMREALTEIIALLKSPHESDDAQSDIDVIGDIARAALGRVADFQEQDERGQLTHLNHISLMPDELQALAELRKLGLASIDVQDDEDGGAAHDAFREALWDYCDDTLYRLLMCVVPHDGARRMSDRKIHWRCFHCGDTFTRAQERWAREHFGRSCEDTPVCLVRVPGEGSLLSALRNAQAELDRHRAEDSDLMRAMWAMSANHSTALRRQEELGYERGFRDGRALAAPSSPARENLLPQEET